MAVVIGIEIQHHETALAAVENMMLFVAVLGWLSAKNTLLGLWCFRRNISHAPGSPKTFHDTIIAQAASGAFVTQRGIEVTNQAT